MSDNLDELLDRYNDLDQDLPYLADVFIDAPEKSSHIVTAILARPVTLHGPLEEDSIYTGTVAHEDVTVTFIVATQERLSEGEKVVIAPFRVARTSLLDSIPEVKWDQHYA